MALVQIWSKLRSIVQALWYNTSHDCDPKHESPELKECFRLLKLTSRSFAAVIQDLEPESRVFICLFYLILRALDTIEDDMTIDIQEKETLLRNFHEITEDDSWTYDGNGPDEKDRELLVKFNVVTKEFKMIKEEYRIIIKDITRMMGEKMAEYAKDMEQTQEGIQTIESLEVYSHYSSGLVCESLGRLFDEAKVTDPALQTRPGLNAMGKFLQYTNFIRDIRKDCEVKRYYWPKEVWSKYVSKLPDLFLPENKEKALQCQSAMICLTLKHAQHFLPYMADLQKSVYKLTAVPVTMAIATIELCFQNYTMFERNIKISRDVAYNLRMRDSQNFRQVHEIFCEYAQKIRQKNRPQDPHFLDINNACDRIEKCIDPPQTTCSLSIQQ